MPDSEQRGERDRVSGWSLPDRAVKSEWVFLLLEGNPPQLMPVTMYITCTYCLHAPKMQLDSLGQ